MRASYSLDITIDPSGIKIRFYLIDDTENPTSEDYVTIHIPHDFGRCIGHLIAAAYAVPRLEPSYRGEYPGVKRTKELTFSAGTHLT